MMRGTEVNKMTEPIRLKKEDGIVEVLFNRPEAFNAFDLDMIDLLQKCLSAGGGVENGP